MAQVLYVVESSPCTSLEYAITIYYITWAIHQLAKGYPPSSWTAKLRQFGRMWSCCHSKKKHPKTNGLTLLHDGLEYKCPFKGIFGVHPLVIRKRTVYVGCFG